MHPVEEEIIDTKVEDVGEFLIDLFVEGGRTGRNLEEELDNTIEADEIYEKGDAGETAEVNLEEVARFNNYMDAVFRRMNAALRAKLMDPMELNLNQKSRKDSDKKDKKEKKDGKKRVEREATDIEEMNEENLEKDTKDLVDRMGAADKKKLKKGKNKENKKDKNKNKNKKNETKNKNKGDKNKADKIKNKNKGGNKEKDPKVKAQNKAERQKKREEKRAMKKKEKNARKAGELFRGKRAKQSEEKHDKNKGREDKKSEEEGKAMGSLSGIATLRRSGDVTVQEDESHILVTSVFTVGPLQLEVSKSLGHGKARTVKTAKATTDLMTGVMVLKVKPDGSAHVKKVVFKKPEHVDVTGTITSGKKERSENILKNSFNRSRPLAAQKILKTARYVLKGSSNINHS
eukprot:TRINITY_DN435_c0_g1_i1.p1 TRINITY_DN435_c0_g1~~TRINITY_DN435_c0_g1_i1.p1  ORF type:complete len:452 (+),score=171.19 TRINITY_DN435_c0_g1_i1:149-1357(+)